MEAISKPLHLRRRRVIAFRGRGPIYNWLRAHHGHIVPMMKTGTATWPALCEEMSRHGVVSRDGSPPSTRAASKAWQTVCRDLQEDERAKAAQPKRVGVTAPSRISKDWRPSGFRQPAQSVQATSPAPPANHLPAVPGFRPPPINDGRPPDPSPEEEAALLNYLLRRGPPPPPPAVDLTAEGQIRRLRGEMNLRSGRRYDDPGDYAARQAEKK